MVGAKLPLCVRIPYNLKTTKTLKMADEVTEPLLRNRNNIQCRDNLTTIGIIGTGNYATALSKRLVMAGYDVILGSRCPGKRELDLNFAREGLSDVKVTSISECFNKCYVVFVAIHVEDFRYTLKKFTKEAKGKILIDISNRKERHVSQSNSEILASVLPQSVVVKGFNSISAYTMDDLGADAGNHRVFIASNDPEARSVVGDLAKAMGFRVVDLGGLKSALHMENFVLKVFSLWKIPIILTFGIFNLWSLYIAYIYFIEGTKYEWEQVFLKVFNKPLCMTAITMLALTYLPGQAASLMQIYNGTKHKRFPSALDTWLKSRKQLGLISLFLATIHVIASSLMMSPTYYGSWFHHATVTFPVNISTTSDLVIPVSTSWMTWKGEAACVVGISAFVLMAVIGITSIPSVGDSLNWSEWRWVHSKMGYAVLFLTVAHVCIMGAAGWIKDGPIKAFKSITFLSVLLPSFVLLLKIIFMCPPLKGYVRKIRRGWERSTDCKSSLTFVEEKRTMNGVTSSRHEYMGNGLHNMCGCGDNGAANGNMGCGCRNSGLPHLDAQCACSSV